MTLNCNNHMESIFFGIKYCFLSPLNSVGCELTSLSCFSVSISGGLHWLLLDPGASARSAAHSPAAQYSKNNT